MRRVVVTGMGIVSSIGNSAQEVTASLHDAKSGITRAETYAAMGFKSQVQGQPVIDWAAIVPRKPKRFMESGLGWSYIAMDQAIRDAGLEAKDVVNERTGIIAGSGGPSTLAVVNAADITRKNGAPKKIGPFEVPKAMSSGPSAVLATSFQIKGVNYSITSACSTSAHCIGNAAEMIQYGKQDVMFAGGCEELEWTLSALFDAMGAMSSRFNDTPSRASRAYDKNRDGFVIAGGAGMMVLEELEHAKARGAKIYGELAGYGATSDGFDMVAPSGEGGDPMHATSHERHGWQGHAQDRLYQSAWHGHTGRRRARNCGHQRRFRGDQSAVHLIDEVADGTLAGCHRRAGGNILAANDEQRIFVRKRAYR